MNFLINQVSEDLKKSKAFWLACALVEAGAGQDNGRCMPPNRVPPPPPPTPPNIYHPPTKFHCRLINNNFHVIAYFLMNS